MTDTPEKGQCSSRAASPHSRPQMPATPENFEDGIAEAGALPGEAIPNRVEALFAQLSSPERDLISAVARAAGSVTAVLEENESRLSLGKRRHREATLSTVRSDLIHARHNVEASGLRKKLSAAQEASLADFSTVHHATR